LQVLDEGRLTDSLGRRIDFRNTIIIMTSNIGTRQLSEYGRGVGFETSAKRESFNSHAKGVIENALKKTFAPEFINRIDDVVLFNSLLREDIHKIIDLELKGLYQRVKIMGYELKISAQAKDFISERGFDVQFGARPLKRALQKYLEDPMAEIIIKNPPLPNDVIIAGFNKKAEHITFKIQNKNKTVEKNKDATSK